MKLRSSGFAGEDLANIPLEACSFTRIKLSSIAKKKAAIKEEDILLDEDADKTIEEPSQWRAVLAVHPPFGTSACGCANHNFALTQSRRG